MRKHIAHGLAVVLSVASLGAAQRPNSSGSNKAQASSQQQTAVVVEASAVSKIKSKADKPYQVGTASWYGSYFQGKATASGEPYNMYDMTAAHMNLPLGTFVKVTNLRNGRSAVLRVNDRGPYVDGRVIDVSYNAAKALDFKARGLQRVRIDVVHPELVASLR
jgi:rare lipoprotein A (peptidoglycan hydrolase)